MLFLVLISVLFAGKGLANPTALLLSSLMMLRHMGLTDYATKIEKAALTVSSFNYPLFHLAKMVLQTIAEGKTITGDLGGKSSTKEYTAAIVDKLSKV